MIPSHYYTIYDSFPYNIFEISKGNGKCTLLNFEVSRSRRYLLTMELNRNISKCTYVYVYDFNSWPFWLLMHWCVIIYIFLLNTIVIYSMYVHLIIFRRCLILLCKWYPERMKEWVEVLIISQPYHNIIEKSTMNVQPHNGLEDIAILIRRFIAYVYVTYIHISNSTFHKYFINNLRKWLQIAYYYYDVYMRVIT